MGLRDPCAIIFKIEIGRGDLVRDPCSIDDVDIKITIKIKVSNFRIPTPAADVEAARFCRVGKLVTGPLEQNIRAQYLLMGQRGFVGLARETLRPMTEGALEVAILRGEVP